MPRHCPVCGDIVEVKRYVVPAKEGPVTARSNGSHLEAMDVWECTPECGWAEDVGE